MSKDNLPALGLPVRIKTEKEILDYYDIEDLDSVPPGWDEDMREFLGKETHITSITSDPKYVRVDIDLGRWSWDLGMLATGKPVTETTDDWWL